MTTNLELECKGIGAVEMSSHPPHAEVLLTNFKRAAFVSRSDPCVSPSRMLVSELAIAECEARSSDRRCIEKNSSARLPLLQLLSRQSLLRSTLR